MAVHEFDCALNPIWQGKRGEECTCGAYPSKQEPWITTYTGKRVNPLDLKPEDICIEDIAHHLTFQNRFVGALQFPVSIAEHSCIMAMLVPSNESADVKLQALLHDASEAYLNDIPKWVKECPEMTFYREAERRAEEVIGRVFGIPPGKDGSQLIGDLDRFVVRCEAYDGFSHVENYDMGHPDYTCPTSNEWTIFHRMRRKFHQMTRLEPVDRLAIGLHVEATFLDMYTGFQSERLFKGTSR